MNDRASKIENEVQDKNSVAWQRLCEYVDNVEAENLEEFTPLEALGRELFSQIYILPETMILTECLQGHLGPISLPRKSLEKNGEYLDELIYAVRRENRKN